MFNILHYTYLRLGDAHRFGPPPVRKGRMGITTEKGKFRTPIQMRLAPGATAFDFR
jgi:hypothetical protein